MIDSLPKIQYGTEDAVTCTPGETTQIKITYPEAFSSTPTTVFSIRHNYAGIGEIYTKIMSPSTTGFTALIEVPSSGASRAYYVNWISIGN